MKTRIFLLTLFCFVMFACSEAPNEKGTGFLTLNINQSAGLKADVEIEDFILRINNGRVDVIKERIRDLPAEIALPVGVYTIEAYSKEFSTPKFDEPFYIGRTTVEIEAGESKEASLVCSQGNAGIKVVWSDEFSILYSTYHAQIEHNEDYLHYSSTETRTGYFLPGTVSVIIQADGFTINGGTITLAARDMVTATLRPKNENIPSGSFTIEISIDNTVNERDVTVIVDPDYPTSNSETNPYTIAQAIERQGENNVWVTGYIVGAKPLSGHNFVDESTWLATNIVLADDIDETDDWNVIFVELGSSGLFRTNLNLVANEGILYRKILLRGNLLQYQSRAGLRNLTGGFSFIE